MYCIGLRTIWGRFQYANAKKYLCNNVYVFNVNHLFKSVVIAEGCRICLRDVEFT